jgi:hypothetical protein
MMFLKVVIWDWGAKRECTTSNATSNGVMPNFVQLFLIYFKSHSARNWEAKNRLTTLKRSR